MNHGPGEVIPLKAANDVRDQLRRPVRDLRLSVIETCNFRCPYCMPEDAFPFGATEGSAFRLTFDQLETVVRAFVRLGVSKLRLTGGEPLLRKGLPDFIRRLTAINGIEDMALTTNASLLARQARALHKAGLHRLTVSLDSLDPKRFAALSGGRGRLADVLAGIEAAEDAGFERIKFNCVVQRGVNEVDVLPLVERFRGSGHVLRFIEFMDVGTCNGWSRERVVPSGDLLKRIAQHWPLRSLQPNYRGEVASRYAFEDGQGEIGFISSVSAPFCGDCQRARVSADGQLFTCLFASAGHDLRGLIDAGEDVLADALAAIWRQRSDRYSERRAEAGEAEHVEMFRIGG
ncbi:MAG: GTP 3',8-cyclase MoaA [Xanthomonadales bacterium]|nr:GTP 3',8-cyclase MoaA [Xanthomonadales bacterium]